MKQRIVQWIASVCALALLVQLTPANLGVSAEESGGVSSAETMEQTGEGEAPEEGDAEPEILDEDETKREESVKYFRCSDGTYIAAQYATPVHYKDAQGKWADYDNRLTVADPSVEEDAQEYENRRSDLSVRLAKKAKSNKMVRLEGGSGGELSWGYLDAAKSTVELTEKTAPTEGKERFLELSNTTQEAWYRELYADVDLQVLVAPGKVKENLVLKNKPARRRFDVAYKTEGLIPVQTDARTVTLRDGDGKTVYTLEAPSMSDAAGEYSEALTLTLIEVKNKKFTVRLEADGAWLDDAERVYPVTVDPVVNSPTNRDRVTARRVYQRYPDNCDKTSHLLTVGSAIINNTTPMEFRSFVKLELPTQIDSTDRVVGAYLYLTYSQEDNSSRVATQVNVHRVTKSWDANTITWNNSQQIYDPLVVTDYAIAEYTKRTEDAFDITTLVEGWITNPSSNYGVMLKSNAVNQSEADYIHYYTNEIIQGKEALRPYAEIHFRDTKGIEPYWTYTSLAAGRTGTAYVNNFNGRLSIVSGIASAPGSRMPADIELVYNCDTAQWKTNYETLHTEKTTGELQKNFPYKLTDADGTEHYFYLSGGKYIDEDGLGYTLTEVNEYDVKYVIADKEGGKMQFNHNGDLYDIKDASGNQLYVTYRDNFTKVQSVRDGANRTYTYGWDGDRLSSITDPSGRKVTFSSYGGHLTGIHYPDGYVTPIEYEGSKLTKIKSTVDNTALTLGYEGSRVKSMKLTGGSLTAASYTFSYQQYATVITDQSGRKVTYQFNRAGQTVGLLNNQTGQGEFYEFGAPGQTKAGAAPVSTGRENKLLSSSKVQASVTNYMKNPSFKEGRDNYSVYPESAASTARFVWDSTGHNGRLATAIVRDAAASTSLFYFQSVALSPGTYTASVYVYTKNVGGDGAWLGVNAFANGAYATGASSEPVKGSVSWKRLTATFVIPSGSNTYAHVGVCLGANTTGTVYVDDFQLELGETANDYNLVENAALSQGTTSWTNGAAPQTTTVVGLPGYGKALSATGNSKGTKEYRQTINISGNKGDSFSYGGYIKAANVGTNVPKSTGTPTCEIRLEFSGGGTTYKVAYSTYNAWQFVSGKAIAPGSYSTVTIVCSYNYNMNTAYFTGLYAYKDPYGQSYTYDPQGNVTSSVDMAEAQATFAYKNNDLSKLLNPTGSRYFYSHTDKHQLEYALTTDGQQYSAAYDSVGNPVSASIQERKLATSITAGKAYIIVNAGTGNALDNGATAFSSTRVNNHRVQPDSNVCQRWIPRQVSGDTYTLESVRDSTLELAANSENLLYILGKQSTASHRFRIAANTDGSFAIISAENNYYLDSLPDGKKTAEDGDAVKRSPQIVYRESQAWYFYEVESPGPKILTRAGYADTYNKNYMTSVKDERGNTTSYTYNANKGTLSTVKDAKNNTTSYTYEANTDRVTKVESSGSSVSYAYGQDRLTSILHNNNQVKYSFGYDELGRNTQVTVGNNSGTGSYTLSTNTYNDRSLLTKQQYGNGHSVHYAYDNLDRVTGKGYNGSASAYQYGYDAQGRLSVTKDTVNNRYTRLTYDLAGRLAESETRSGENSNTALKTWLGYTYENKTNRLSKLTYQTPKHGSTSTYRNAPFEITYGTGSNRDRVRNLGHNGVFRLAFGYDGLGRVTSRGYSTTAGGTFRSTTYTYAAGGETNTTTSLVASISNSGLGTLSYTYDANGNIASISQDGVLRESYTYDGLNQLKSVTRGGVTTSYTYDAGGNILTRTTGSSTIAYGYGDAQWKDKLTSWNGQTITYDAIGNPLQYRDGISLTWKNGRQLATMTKSGTSASYTYDEDGNRLTRTVNGLTTTYYRIGGQLVGQYRSDGKDVGYFLDGNGGVYGIYYDDVTKPGGARTYYFIYNAQGDVIGLYNFNGTLVATYSYDEWGKCTVNALIPDDAGNPTTSGNHVAYFNQFRYRGYMFDDETGFYYLGSRYYDPTTGRFINADGTISGTKESVQGYNLYTYCFNNPVNMDDQSGYWPQWIKNAVRAVVNVATQVKAMLSLPSTIVKIATASIIAIESGKATVEDVSNDIKNYSFYNADETKVLNSKVFSSYKGTPVLKHDISGITSFSVSNTIILNKSENVKNGGIDTVKHEWGHTAQQTLLGTPKYLTRIAAPSIISCIVNPSSKAYYSLPWERTADFFGGVNRSTGYYTGSDVVAGLYFIMP